MHKSYLHQAFFAGLGGLWSEGLLSALPQGKAKVQCVAFRLGAFGRQLRTPAGHLTCLGRRSVLNPVGGEWAPGPTSQLGTCACDASEETKYAPTRYTLAAIAQSDGMTMTMMFLAAVDRKGGGDDSSSWGIDNFVGLGP